MSKEAALQEKINALDAKIEELRAKKQELARKLEEVSEPTDADREPLIYTAGGKAQDVKVEGIDTQIKTGGGE